MKRSRIDVHAHIVPDIYRSALVDAGIVRPDGAPGIPAWTESEAIDAMDSLDIETAVLSISSPGVHFGDDGKARQLARAVNENAAQLVRAYPDRFRFFASVPLPDVAGSVFEASYALDALGADGIVVETNHHGMYLGDDRLAPLYAEIERHGAILFVHPTSPHGAGCAPLASRYPAPMLEFMFETTRSVTDLILAGMTVRYPGMRVIVPHAGAALAPLAARIALVSEAFMKRCEATLDFRAELARCYFDLAGAPVPELLTSLLGIAEPDHLLYGSDWPWTPLEIARNLANALDSTPLLSDELRTAIMTTNAEQLFRRRGHPHVLFESANARR
jgi:predicted TIM-barrel fold metal-dependent hydrolase